MTEKLDPREVATRMRAIEDNITGETGEDTPALDRVVAVLLWIEYEGLDKVLGEEAARVNELLRDWYRLHGVKATPANIAGFGIVQGITFAVAAQRLARERDGDALRAEVDRATDYLVEVVNARATGDRTATDRVLIAAVEACEEARRAWQAR